ncbi:MAG: 4Fe-4S dicluster domain-containing protein [Lentisphaeria bacterium]|jgi:NAD-dependent dihydropyrimidine dehydrogenase PreA subunit|nr:4Fe-4S dicluster domain-containing protein [Lentisphaeria bacterium]
MKRKIIQIDERKCNGCGLCVPACHEGALAIVDGKARLVKDSYCDGLGDCLGECPQGAITIEERDVDAYDEAAVQKHLADRAKARNKPQPPSSGGCPGLRAFTLASGGGCPGQQAKTLAPAKPAAGEAPASALGQWPIQLHLVSPQAPYWQDADLLVAADCVLAAYPGLHKDLLPGRKLVIACPKLDDTGNYVEKLASIIGRNSIRSLTIARMEVPCCGGIQTIAEQALARSGKHIPVQTITIGIQGDVLGRN